MLHAKDLLMWNCTQMLHVSAALHLHASKAETSPTVRPETCTCRPFRSTRHETRLQGCYAPIMPAKAPGADGYNRALHACVTSIAAPAR